MAALSWNEIRSRAIHFSKEWEHETCEDAEAKSFWDDFFNIFGISRRKIASFEKPVKKLDETTGYIDLLWKGTILVEHKSRGKNLDKAYKQALDYFPGLKDYELPRYVLVSDFARFRLYDLDEGYQHEFLLEELYKNVKEFGFIAGYQKQVYKEEDPVNIRAAELMGRLHDKLREIGYEGHPLEVYLVRLLFCLFAEDTSIFEKDQFRDFIVNKTREDGSDLGSQLSSLFFILNTTKEHRLRNLDEEMAAFPFVNGRLFEETLPQASFDSSMRTILLDSTALNWGKISPAIFGSLFQSVKNPVERRNLGAHYTSEKNILKVIRPLFLDDLWHEFERAKESRNSLMKFHDKLASLRFLDPACGCGNFLVITYRELRLLEIEIIKVLQKGQQVFDVHELIRLDVDRFYGIEIEEFPSQIAQVALWLMDHQMNMKASEEFGEYFIRLPLRKHPNIAHDNALRIAWQSLIDPIPWENKEQRFDYIFGNPPFSGKSLQNAQQKSDMDLVFNGVRGAGVLDFVTAWYIKAAQYLSQNETLQTRCAFVSTNSISQGEQVGVLWNELFNRYKIKIHFAHRAFKWTSEARGKAAVHVVIIGFSNFNIPEKRIFEYEDIKGEPHEVTIKNINPYLVEGKDFVILSKCKPISSVPEMYKGSQPTDGGNLLLTNNEKIKLIETEPIVEKFIKPFISAKEFINNKQRWCFWLVKAPPAELRQISSLRERIENIRKMRSESTKLATRKWAQYPTVFTENRQPDSDYILIPRHSSENRKYIPFGFFSKDFIVADSCSSIPNATLFHFGVLTSEMHMVWIKHVAGRLESRFRYSNDIVYNNYPWPENPTEKQVKAVEEAAQKALDVREKYLNPEISPSHQFSASQSSKTSLADLYDPITMPPDLVKAHQELDKAVDLCYRPQPFLNETKRIEYLFELYDKYTAGMFVTERKRKKK